MHVLKAVAGLLALSGSLTAPYAFAAKIVGVREGSHPQMPLLSHALSDHLLAMTQHVGSPAQMAATLSECLKAQDVSSTELLSAAMIFHALADPQILPTVAAILRVSPSWVATRFRFCANAGRAFAASRSSPAKTRLHLDTPAKQAEFVAAFTARHLLPDIPLTSHQRS